MALTRITKGVIKPNENYDTHNINSTGIVTAIGLDINGNADVSGSLSVGGVLTYEDVTSIDSVGIITARSGLVSPYADIDDFVSVGSNIHLGNAGVITATSFVGSGAALTGIDATAIKDSGGNVKVQAQASGAMYTGIHTFSSGAEVGSNIKLGNAGVITATSFVGSGAALTGIDATAVKDSGGNVKIQAQASGAVYTGIHTFGTNTNFTDIDVDGHTNLDNLNIAGVSTFAGTLNASTVSSTAFIASGDLDVDGHTFLDNVSIAGVTTVAGNIIGSQPQTFIGADTSDGSDNKSMMLGGGGASSVSRGAYVWVKGNEYSGAGGELILAGGGVSSSLIDFYTNSGQRARITSTGELNIGGSYTQTTNKLNVTGTTYVSSDITSGDDIIAADEIRNNVPGDFWASDNTFINLNGFGNLTHQGGFEVNLTSNGYRDTNGQWVSLAANSNTGAAQIGLAPQGNIIFRTDASKSNGTAHNPTERLRITSGGDLGLTNTGTNNPNNYSGWCTLTINGTSGAELDFEKGGSLKGDILANDTSFAMTTRDSAVDINFATKNNAGSSANRLTINSEGSIHHKSGSGVSYFNGASEYVFGSASSSPASGGNEGNVQIHTSKTRASFSINAYQNNAGAPFMQFISSRSGTVGTLGTVAANNDYLGDIRFCGDNGAGGVATGATIQVRAKTAATTNGMAARIEFSTAKDASSNTRQVFSMGEGGAFTGESDTAALEGYHTSLNNTNNYVDLTQWTRDSFVILELFGGVNPNSSGSGAYNDPVHMYIYKGTGWTGSRLGHYIYCVSVAPPARQAFPSGTGYSGNAQISAVWTDGSSTYGNETATSTHYIRLLIPNGNNSNSFTKSFRIFRRR